MQVKQLPALWVARAINLSPDTLVLLAAALGRQQASPRNPKPTPKPKTASRPQHETQNSQQASPHLRGIACTSSFPTYSEWHTRSHSNRNSKQPAGLSPKPKTACKPQPKTQGTKHESQRPKPEAWNPKPGNRCPTPGTRNLKSGTSNPKS